MEYLLRMSTVKVEQFKLIVKFNQFKNFIFELNLVSAGSFIDRIQFSVTESFYPDSEWNPRHFQTFETSFLTPSYYTATVVACISLCVLGAEVSSRR